MTKTTEKTISPNNGFAIPLQPDTELGMAMLIAESEDGHHEPVAIASTINEARELATSDFRDRMRRLERGEEDVLCPYVYKVWARGINGYYRLAFTITEQLM